MESDITALRDVTGLTAESGNPLQVILSADNWLEDETISSAVEPILMRICARYLLKEKERSGRSKDPVAHFHLTNGALVERVGWKGVTAEVGLSRS